MEPTRDVSRQAAVDAAGGGGGGPPTLAGLLKESADVIGPLVVYLGALKPLTELLGRVPTYALGAALFLAVALYRWRPHRRRLREAGGVPHPGAPRRWPWWLRLAIPAVALAALLVLWALVWHRRVILPATGQPSVPGQSCGRTEAGELRLAVEPTPGRPRGNGWSAACCVELGRAGVRVPPSSSLRVALTLDHADQVEIKVEQGRYGDADHVGWLTQGPLEPGNQVIDGPLRMTPGGQPLEVELRAHRICAALVDGGPERNQLRLKTAAWH